MKDNLKAVLKAMSWLERLYPAIRLISLGFFIGVAWQVFSNERATVRKELDALTTAVKEVQSSSNFSTHDVIRLLEITKSVDARLQRLENRP
jgi:hypothetical protein